MKSPFFKLFLVLFYFFSITIYAQDGGGSGPIIPLPGSIPTRVDSSQLSPGVTRPSTGIQQIVTQVAVPCDASGNPLSTAALQAWASHTGFNCNINTTNPVCFVQLRASPSDSAPQNTLTCPSHYSPLFSFGTAVINVTDLARPLVYTQADTKTMLTLDQYNFYAGQQYQCGQQDTGVQYNLTYSEILQSVSRPAPPYPPYRFNVGQFTTFNGIYVQVTSRTVINDCYSAQTNSPISLDGCLSTVLPPAYWRSTFTYSGLPLKCTRAAGFYPAPTTTTYALPPPSTSFSPTTLICGQAKTAWVPVPQPPNNNNPVVVNQCVTLPSS